MNHEPTKPHPGCRDGGVRITIGIGRFDVQVGDTHADLNSFPVEPWRNGGGTTRPLAYGPNWRVSVATVTDRAIFSRLPGVARMFTPWIHGSVTLHGSTQLPHDESGVVRFDGGDLIMARVANPPALAINLMASAAHIRMEAHRRRHCIELRIDSALGHQTQHPADEVALRPASTAKRHASDGNEQTARV